MSAAIELANSLLQPEHIDDEIWNNFINDLESLYAARSDLRAIPNVKNISSEEFICRYALTGLPVVLSNAASDWPAITWSLDKLKERFGDLKIILRAGSDYDRMERREVELGLYIDSLSRGEHFYAAGNNIASFDESSRLKLREDLRTPPYFPSSRFSERSGQLWLGGRGTGTHLHRDLTDNFIVQLFGRKIIFLLAPNYSKVVSAWKVTRFLHSSKVDISNRDLLGACVLDLTLFPGDILYIPCGWFHQIKNLDTSCSINFFTDISVMALPEWDKTFPSIAGA